MDVAMDTSEPPERITELMRRSEDECFTVFAMRNPIPFAVTSTVNGEKFSETT